MTNVLKNTVKIMGAVLTLSMMSTIANATDQICQLGQTCNIPDKAFDTVRYAIHKDFGGNYKCTFTTADAGTLTNSILSVNIGGGNAFNVRTGLGPHIIKDSPAVIDVGGYFTANLAEGEIVITKIAGSGTVNCIRS